MSPCNRYGEGFGKPKLPEISGSDISSDDLSKFVGPASWLLFKCLKIDTSFLETPSSQWHQDPAFTRGMEIIENLSVTNDAAERGVKLSHDFMDSAKGEQTYQNILQVVENHRKNIPNQRKRNPNNKNWFLHL